MKPKIIVFDLYNTLIKIQKKQNLFRQIYKNCQLQNFISLTDFINLILTKDIKLVFDDLANSFKSEYDKLLPKFEEELKSVIVFPEVHAVLKNLSANYPLYLISNLASIYKQPFYGLELDQYFEKAIFSCDVGFIKPDSKIFKIVEESSRKTGNQILMIGDSLNADILGAKQMNWQTLRINRNLNICKNSQIQSLLEIENRL